MTFTATHTRDLVGTDITVTATAGPKEQIATVTVAYDGDQLEEEELEAGSEEYSRSFSQVGSVSPGMDHTLVISVIDAAGQPHSATTRWTDS